jgi:hypothetical protein
MHAHAHAHTQRHTHTRTHRQTNRQQTDTCTHTHTHTHTRTRTRTQTQTDTRTHTHTQTPRTIRLSVCMSGCQCACACDMWAHLIPVPNHSMRMYSAHAQPLPHCACGMCMHNFYIYIILDMHRQNVRSHLFSSTTVVGHCILLPWHSRRRRCTGRGP